MPVNEITTGRRKNAGDPTIVDDANLGYETGDGLHERAEVGHDFDEVDGDGKHRAGFVAKSPNVEIDSLDAHQVVEFFLDEPAHVSPSFNWKRAIRQTSWYAELGAPPTHGAFIINASQNKIEWVDLDSDTLAVYMPFNISGSATMNIAGTSSSNLTCIAVKDFRILIGCDANTFGVGEIDLLADMARYKWTAGDALYNGKLSERDDTLGYTNYSTGLYVVNNNINSVAICRDPSGGTDHFGRPLHYWVMGTGTTSTSGCIFNPTAGVGVGAIYDTTLGDDTDFVCENGIDIFWIMRDSSPDSIYGYLAESAKADAFASEYYLSQSATDGTRLGYSAAHAISALAAYQDLLFYGTGEGLGITHLNRGSSVDSARIFLSSTFALPLAVGSSTGVYPLDSVTDRSGNGYNLSNIGTTAFSGTSPLGVSCANLDGSDDILRLTGESGFGEGCNVSVWFKTATSTNPSGSADYVLTLSDGAGTAGLIHLYNDTDGGFDARWSTGGGGSYDTISFSSDITDAEWHHVYMGRVDGSSSWELWIDGVQVGTTSVTNAAGTFSLDELRVGADQSNNNLFAGEVAQLSIGSTAWTDDEIRLEYSRMQAGLSGFTTLLAADDIDSVQIAPSGEYGIACAGDVAHVFDPRTGIILSTKAVGAGTLNDAAIWQRDGAETPSYLLGASGTVEAVQPDERIGG